MHIQVVPYLAACTVTKEQTCIDMPVMVNGTIYHAMCHIGKGDVWWVEFVFKAALDSCMGDEGDIIPMGDAITAHSIDLHFTVQDCATRACIQGVFS